MSNKDKKRFKDFFNLGIRKLKHRKGFGVHSPFAFSIITEVIEEKLPYYAYGTMQKFYKKEAPVSFKTACLLFRLANRFRFHSFVEIQCDGGYSMLPVMLADSHNHIYSVTTEQNPIYGETVSRLDQFKVNKKQYSFVEHISHLYEDEKYDMLLINKNPFDQADKQRAASNLIEWITTHTHEGSVIFAMGIQKRQPLEFFWDMLCDQDEITITMDLYNNGLAIIKQNFFKQHYIVSF